MEKTEKTEKLTRERRIGKEMWREKKWYDILAPSMFGGVKIGETVSLDPHQLVGRVFETTLGDLIEDFSKSHIKIYFQVKNVDGNRALTNFIGHDIVHDFIRSQVRRRATKLDSILTVTTQDGYKLRVTSIVITFRRIQSSQIQLIRSCMKKTIESRAQDRTLDQFVQELVLGKITADIYKEAKKYCPIKRVEVQKSKLLSIPQAQVQ